MISMVSLFFFLPFPGSLLLVVVFHLVFLLTVAIPPYLGSSIPCISRFLTFIILVFLNVSIRDFLESLFKKSIPVALNVSCSLFKSGFLFFFILTWVY
jgi:hypothetical protein